MVDTNLKTKQLEIKAGASSTSDKSERLKILIVEDSKSARLKIVESLKSLDLKIFEADDGTSALKILRNQKIKIDLVLTDLNMKTMDGDELCSKIRNELKRSGLPVIVLSSKIDKKTTVNLFKKGATDFLYKPFTAEELVVRINTHLERLRLNKILIKQIGQLKDLNQIKDDLIAVCSHDFRSPLQIIMGYTELLMEDCSTTETHRDMLTSIKKSSDSLLEMIDEVLVLGKAERLTGKVGITSQPIKKLIRSCVTNFYGLASKKNISLTFSDIDGSPMVNGNQNEFIRIFNNLLSNAIKFTPAGGVVSVGLELDKDTTLVVSISDTGIGIADDAIPQLFKKYSPMSRKGTEGELTTGLGLFITKELIDKNLGEIIVESEIAKGSCFIVRFPLADHSYAEIIQGLIDMEKR